ncbi:MAG: prepilin-type N-terminal cleavage/methylation domain-containing protein [bacterium]|nr:prepilin-type N-terminal cleavage/methylation domain-containing protein [bacterium]
MLHVTRYKLHASRAFTLIEILLVLGITAILLVIGTISMLGYVGRQNLESEARAITALMRDAQSKSMGQYNDNRWGVYLYNSVGSERDFSVIFQADETLVASSTYLDVPGTSLERKTMRPDIEFVSPAESTTTIVLFSKVSGLPNASTSVILQKDGDSSNQKTIFISGNGKIDYQ